MWRDRVSPSWSGGVMMSMREIERFLEQWQMGIKDLHCRTALLHEYWQHMKCPNTL